MNQHACCTGSDTPASLFSSLTSSESSFIKSAATISVSVTITHCSIRTMQLSESLYTFAGWHPPRIAAREQRINRVMA